MILYVALCPFEITPQKIPLKPSKVHHVVVVVGHAAPLSIEHPRVVAEVRGRPFEQVSAQLNAHLPIDREGAVDDRALDELLATF